MIFTGHLRNRGLRGVGSNMSAAFCLSENRDTVLYQTETFGPVARGGRQSIHCVIPKTVVPKNAVISMVVNDAGGGARLVDECNYDNNIPQVTVEKCQVVG